MDIRSDIAIFDKRGAPAALVEVRGKLGTTPDWAAAMRRNLAAHGSLPETRFFLLATPDRFYFWVDKAGEPEAVLPDFAFEPMSALKPYYEHAGAGPTDLDESSFELIVASLLSELSHGAAEERVPAEAARWLRDSGFLDLIRGGRLAQH